MIRCRGKLLRNHEYVQAFEQSGRNGNVRQQEKEIVVSVVLVIVGRGEITARPHGTAAVGLRLEKAVCVPGGTVLASISTVHTKQTECDNSH